MQSGVAELSGIVGQTRARNRCFAEDLRIHEWTTTLSAKMLQWTGGSRRKLRETKRSMKSTQHHFFEQRNKQLRTGDIHCQNTRAASHTETGNPVSDRRKELKAGEVESTNSFFPTISQKRSLDILGLERLCPRELPRCTEDMTPHGSQDPVALFKENASSEPRAYYVKGVPDRMKLENANTSCSTEETCRHLEYDVRAGATSPTDPLHGTRSVRSRNGEPNNATSKQEKFQTSWPLEQAPAAMKIAPSEGQTKSSRREKPGSVPAGEAMSVLANEPPRPINLADCFSVLDIICDGQEDDLRRKSPSEFYAAFALKGNGRAERQTPRHHLLQNTHVLVPLQRSPTLPRRTMFSMGNADMRVKCCTQPLGMWEELEKIDARCLENGSHEFLAGSWPVFLEGEIQRFAFPQSDLKICSETSVWNHGYDILKIISPNPEKIWPTRHLLGDWPVMLDPQFGSLQSRKAPTPRNWCESPGMNFGEEGQFGVFNCDFIAEFASGQVESRGSAPSADGSVLLHAGWSGPSSVSGLEYWKNIDVRCLENGPHALLTDSWPVLLEGDIQTLSSPKSDFKSCREATAWNCGYDILKTVPPYRENNTTGTGPVMLDPQFGSLQHCRPHTRNWCGSPEVRCMNFEDIDFGEDSPVETCNCDFISGCAPGHVDIRGSAPSADGSLLLHAGWSSPSSVSGNFNEYAKGFDKDQLDRLACLFY